MTSTLLKRIVWAQIAQEIWALGHQVDQIKILRITTLVIR